MNNVLARSAVQKYPASMQSYGYHSPKHGCGMENLSSLCLFFSFLTKHVRLPQLCNLPFSLDQTVQSCLVFQLVCSLPTSQRARINGLSPARHWSSWHRFSETLMQVFDFWPRVEAESLRLMGLRRAQQWDHLPWPCSLTCWHPSGSRAAVTWGWPQHMFVYPGVQWVYGDFAGFEVQISAEQ